MGKIMGPLDGIKVVEFGGIGPGPMAATMLTNMGADVIRLQRSGAQSPVDMPGGGADMRNRPALDINLKDPDDVALALDILESADVLLEGFRPGVMERLGLGPDVALARNPRLVYGRITGYGQTGTMADQVGHDINYMAISGVLSALGAPGEAPRPPINLLADFGAGAMLIALGICSALVQVQRGGPGQVVDAAMVDGTAQLALTVFSFAGAGSWGPPGTNILDGGAHFYGVYETSDGGHMAVGPIEAPFYRELLRVLDIDEAEMPQWDVARWPEFKSRLAAMFKARTRAEWEQAFAGSDACATPVLTLDEVAGHEHHRARRTFVEEGGRFLPGAAPRFSGATAGSVTVGSTHDMLSQWDLPDGALEEVRLRSS